MNIKQFFIPRTVDNSPVKWGRFIAKTVTQSTAATVGMWGGIVIIACIYNEWDERGQKVKELEKQLAELKKED